MSAPGMDTRNANTFSRAQLNALYWECVYAHSHIRALERGHAENHPAFLPVIRACRAAFWMALEAGRREGAQPPRPTGSERTTDRYTQLGLFAQEARTS